MSIDRRTIIGIATTVLAVGIFLLSCAQADASLTEFAFSGSFPVPGEANEGLAVDESTDDVYVYSVGISKFDAEGNPVNFSALGSNVITGTGGYGFGEAELAVDNSSGPAKGDIYLAGGAGVQIYGQDGTKLGELTQVDGRPWGEVACGVTVDGSGNVYVGVYPSVVNEYTPSGGAVTNDDYVGSHSGFLEICNIAADHDGSLYAATWSPSRDAPVVKLDSFQSGGTNKVFAHAGGTLAVTNSPSAELFISQGSAILQYDPSGNPLNTFGEGGNIYRSLAINGKNGRLYASSEYKRIQIWQGIIAPDVRTAKATGLGATGTATLNGTVNPEGASVESCSFQYGLSMSYGATVTCAQAPPLNGANAVPVSADVAGLLPNHVYHYRLATIDEHGSRYGADETFTIFVLPTVEDQPPSVSSIAREAAKFTGTINPEQVDATYRFEYGTTEDYVESTAIGHTGVSAVDTTVSQAVGDLLPDTTYHYRLAATNIAGTVFGADHTFVTGSATPPTAITGGSSAIAQNSATIAGTVNTNGLPTTYGFEIGTSTDYGPRTGLGTAGAGLNEASVSLPLTGLVPGTTYHYRLTATNIDGTSYGADQIFTTGVFANTFAEPPAPLPFVSVPPIAFPSEQKAGNVKKKSGKAKGKKVKKHGKHKGKRKTKSKTKKK